MFCFVFTHSLPLFMPGRTHQSKNTASQTQPQALHHPTTSPPSSHQDLSKSRSLWTPLHLPTLLLLLRQLFISLSLPCSECFWPWLNCRRGCSWPSHATPAEPGCPQPGGYHTIYCANCKKTVMFSPLSFLQIQIQMLHHRWTKPLRRTSWGRSSLRRRTGWSSFWWIFSFCWSTEHRTQTGWKSNFRSSSELCAVSLNNSVCRY